MILAKNVAIFRHMANYRIINASVDSLVRIGKAISSPIRIRALQALKKRELCVCELMQLFRFAPSTMSKHMSLLADAGLVQSRREGRWTYYSLTEDSEEQVAIILGLVDLMAGGDPIVAADRDKLPELACH